MKRIILLLVSALLCLSLCSCDSILKKAKSAVTGEEISEMPKDYIATLENQEFSYELYDSYVKLIKYIAPEGESTVVNIPSEIDGRPVTTIGSLCFFDTENDVTEVNISFSVTTIEENAFYYSEGITEITIPDNVRKIGSRAFAWCNNLEAVYMGKGLTEIPEFCFNHCSALKNVNIPPQIAKIGTRAFSYCDGLADFVVPSTVTSVGERAFDSCINLEYLFFEGESTIIGANVIDSCEKAIIIAKDSSTAKQYCEENGLRWSVSKDIEAVVPGVEESESDTSENEA